MNKILSNFVENQIQTKGFAPSVLQMPILESVSSGAGENMIINAKAGSGKTSTIEACCAVIPERDVKRVIFLAFNKDIVNELKGRIPRDVDVKTLHSFGFGVIRWHYGKNKGFDIQVVADKATKAITKRFEAEKWGIESAAKTKYFNALSKIIDLARFNLIDPTSPDLDKIFNRMVATAMFHDVEIPSNESSNMPDLTLSEAVERSLNVLADMNKDCECYDFADMIYRPIQDNLYIFKYDYVFLDECQDFNKAQAVLAGRMRKRDTTVIAVGDPRQAIYGFAGAMNDSFDFLKNTLQAKEMPLSITYRCSTKVTRYAQKIVQDIAPADNASDGTVTNASWKDVEKGDCVLCRNTKPLVSLFFKFLRQKKKAKIKGKDIGKSLIKIVKPFVGHKNNKIMLAHIAKERNKLIARLRKEGVREMEASPVFQFFQDRAGVLEYMASELDRPKKIIQHLNEMFSDEEQDGITLSTQHRSKGLEFDRVFLLQWELNPSPWAKKEWQQVQESNLMYVAITRAKTALYFIDDFNSQEGMLSKTQETVKDFLGNDYVERSEEVSETEEYSIEDYQRQIVLGEEGTITVGAENGNKLHIIVNDENGTACNRQLEHLDVSEVIRASEYRLTDKYCKQCANKLI